MNSIAYREGYKYQLAADFSLEIPILPPEDISTRFIKLTRKGLLTIRQDFAWDGPSGPTEDSKYSMLASCVHDSLYALIRDGQLDGNQFRGVADLIFYNLLLEAGMLPERARTWHWGVSKFGRTNADQASEKVVMTAP